MCELCTKKNEYSIKNIWYCYEHFVKLINYEA